jgi:hypothetical protein
MYGTGSHQAPEGGILSKLSLRWHSKCLTQLLSGRLWDNGNELSWWEEVAGYCSAAVAFSKAAPEYFPLARCFTDFTRNTRTVNAAAFPHTQFTRCDWPRQLDRSAVTITRTVTLGRFASL